MKNTLPFFERVVVSRPFWIDFIAKIQNAFGYNLTGYERLIDKGMEQIMKRLIEKKITPVEYRIEVTQIHNGALVIFLYGVQKK